MIYKADNFSSLHHARVCAVFASEWPDRFPVCEQVIPSSVSSVILGREAYTGSSELYYQEAVAWMRGESAHDEFVHQVFEDTVAIHRHLDLDILFLPDVEMSKPTRQMDEYTFLFGDPDGNDWQLCKFFPSSHQFGAVESGSPPPDFERVVEIMRTTVKEKDPHENVILRPLVARAVKECADEFVIGGSSFMGIPMQPGWLEASLLEVELTAEYLDWIVESNLASMEHQRASGIWYFNGGGDFAYNSGPIYSPTFFEEVMAPRWKRMFDWCRDNDAKYVFRSDGNLWPVADSLFGWAQPHAYYEVDHDAGMHFDKLRERFPELVLIGNVSCDILQRGTADDVRKMALECLEAAAPRFIGASANSILHGTPSENVFALYETVKKYPSTSSARSSNRKLSCTGILKEPIGKT